MSAARARQPFAVRVVDPVPVAVAGGEARHETLDDAL
jgi:hypothetical protein